MTTPLERYEELPRHVKLRVDDYVRACEKIFDAGHNPPPKNDPIEENFPNIWRIIAAKLAEKDLFVGIC